MNPRSGRVFVCTAEVPVCLARSEGEAMLERFFHPDERARLRGRHPQSTAGALAAKRALCALLSQLVPSSAPRERDLVIAHDDLGAPYVRALSRSTGISPDELAVSITHTRRRALGMASFKEGRCER